MAKILYGVMGNTYGHIMRTQALVDLMPEHEFYFVGGGRVPPALAGRYPLLEVPVLRTVHKRGKVSVSATIGQIIRRVAESPRVIRRIRGVIDSWQPDLAICDREFFLPIACRRAGLPCISLDHSHILKACHYPVPWSEKWSWALAMANDHLFFSGTVHHLIVSFFHPKPCKARRGDVNEYLPPVLRRAVTACAGKVNHGDYVLVYQTSATFRPLLHALKSLKRPVIAYGFNTPTEHHDGNIHFKPYDAREILEDLAGCAYAVVNGGHNLICEALYFGKPVLCFPIARLFEQFINAYHVRALGYGDYSTEGQPSAQTFSEFERGLDTYRANITAAGSFDGTERVVARLREVIVEYAKRR